MLQRVLDDAAVDHSRRTLFAEQCGYLCRRPYCFLVGYRIQPLYRAFGMAATSYLSIGLPGFAVWKAAFSP
jgi:hypothetical protein